MTANGRASGHGVSTVGHCNGCRMPLEPSDQFAAQDFDGSGEFKVHNHQFPSANTAIPHLLDLPPEANEAHRACNEGVIRSRRGPRTRSTTGSRCPRR